ncbi:uncharacterized protein LOC143633357 [Bidens hawaiensis]|uniref:uncharacterized protein LOC143633357 n=1 Tax=Bidens hawaiensis TaxID=980011 RepID=UPI00404952BE
MKILKRGESVKCEVIKNDISKTSQTTFYNKKQPVGQNWVAKTVSKPPIIVEEQKGLPRSHDSSWIMYSGTSRHMTATLHLLKDVKSIRGGYVGFAGNQGGQIVGEGTLTNGKVIFDKVNYISELAINLLSI